MLTDESVAQLARQLRQARQERVQMRHLSRAFPGMTTNEAYRIQAEWVRLERTAGRVIRGYKVGLTTPAMQVALRASGPNYAPLLDDMFFGSGADVAAARFIAPRVEVELAFVLGQHLQGPGVTVDDVLKATLHVVPAFEIIDARIEQFDRETREPRALVDVIADLSAAAGAVIGAEPIDPSVVELSQITAILYKNEVEQDRGAGAAVLGHPANSIAWLANRLATQAKGLRKGETILSGSLTKALAIAPGDRVRADYGPKAAVELRLI